MKILSTNRPKFFISLKFSQKPLKPHSGKQGIQVYNEAEEKLLRRNNSQGGLLSETCLTTSASYLMVPDKDTQNDAWLRISSKTLGHGELGRRRRLLASIDASQDFLQDACLLKWSSKVYHSDLTGRPWPTC